MATSSPLALHLRALTRVLFLSLGILGLVGSGVAVGVWTKAGQVAGQSVPLQEVTADALLDLQRIAAGTPRLALSRTVAHQAVVRQGLEERLHHLQEVLERGRALGLGLEPQVVADLSRQIEDLDRLLRDAHQREEQQHATVAATTQQIQALLATTEQLATVLTRVRSTARTQVGASQRRSVQVNDRIKSLLDARRLLSQIDLWLERTRYAASAEEIAELVPRFTTNSERLGEVGADLGDAFADDVQVLVKDLRGAGDQGGFLAIRQAGLAAPAGSEAARAGGIALAAVSTHSAQLANRIGIVIDELDLEIEDTKTAAQGALTSLQHAADAFDSATALATASREIAAVAAAIPNAGDEPEVAEWQRQAVAHLKTVQEQADRLGNSLTALGLSKERRGLTEALAGLPVLEQAISGPDGLLTRTRNHLHGQQAIDSLLGRFTTNLDQVLGTLETTANEAKNQAKTTLGHLHRLSLVAFLLLTTVTVLALAVAWRRSRSISRAILSAEQDQAQRSAVLAHLVERIEEQIVPLNQAAGNLTGTSKALNQRAQGDEGQAQGVASTSRGLAAATSEVTRSAQEIQASITSISDDAQTTQRSAEEAAQAAREASAIITDLAKASGAIAQSTAGVTAIANRTRLLALNASIEAASAGEAGRGFAVVANEVKQLALQTANENANIAQRVTAVQEAVQRAIAAMDRIAGAVSRASEGQSRIAAAVEEQTATTTEMVGRLADIANGLNHTAEAMTGISSNAGSTAQEALDLTAMAEQLTAMASQLETLVKSQSASAAQAPVART